MREKKQSIAVLGSGFIGSHLLKSLADKGGYKLKLFAHRNIPDWIKNIDIPVFKGDVLDKNSLRRIIQKGDTVVNLTGQLAGSKKDFYAANVHGARNIADVCGEKKAKKIIHISSIFIYGELGKRKKPFAEKDKPNPTSYAPTKHFEIFNISSSKGIRLSKVFKYMQSRVPSLKIRRGKPDSSEYRKSIVDNKKAKKLLGFSPKTGLFRGIDLLLRN